MKFKYKTIILMKLKQTVKSDCYLYTIDFFFIILDV